MSRERYVLDSSTSHASASDALESVPAQMQLGSPRAMASWVHVAALARQRQLREDGIVSWPLLLEEKLQAPLLLFLAAAAGAAAARAAAFAAAAAATLACL